MPAQPRSGSILIIVMVTLLFAVAALVAFMDKAGNDLLAEAHVIEADRLRMEAYSALEVTLAVLEDFYHADQGLHSINEGWGHPLEWAGWSPSPGRTVDVSFQDESGKIPLIHADSAILLPLFESWQLSSTDAQRLTDAILSWMQQNYAPATAANYDYEQSAIPFDPPLRPMRSMSELAAIDVARDFFYGPDGRPNRLWWRFCDDFSIFNFHQPDLNGANTDVMSAAGQFDDTQEKAVADFLAGTGNFADQNYLWFKTSSDVTRIVGAMGDPSAFGTTITALRVLITVHEGRAQFRLSAVVAPALGGAHTVQTTATDVKNNASSAASGETIIPGGTPGSTTQPSSEPTSAQVAAAPNMEYPFTILEILENNAIPTPPPDAANGP